MNQQSLFNISEYSSFGKVKGLGMTESEELGNFEVGDSFIHSKTVVECCYPHGSHGQCNHRVVFVTR